MNSQKNKNEMTKNPLHTIHLKVGQWIGVIILFISLFVFLLVPALFLLGLVVCFLCAVFETGYWIQGSNVFRVALSLENLLVFAETEYPDGLLTSALLYIVSHLPKLINELNLALIGLVLMVINYPLLLVMLGDSSESIARSINKGLHLSGFLSFMRHLIWPFFVFTCLSVYLISLNEGGTEINWLGLILLAVPLYLSYSFFYAYEYNNSEVDTEGRDSETEA